MPIFEMSQKKTKNGRRPFVATLYELQPPECVVNEVGTKFNKNGITFLEEYASKQLDSIKDMSVRVEFIDEDRTMIYGHGYTENSEDGLPLFNNATTIGHFTKGYIADVEINGETKRCVCGKGYLDEMAYHPFIVSLEEQLQKGQSVDGSIEIFRTDNNDAIVYKYGYIPQGRIPTEYIHSGWDMVINPADVNSTLLELNNNKNKEEVNLDEKVLKDLIVSTITETNSVKADMDAKIAELNSVVAEKDSTIAELNASVEELQKELKESKDECASCLVEKETLVKELNEAKARERVNELNEAIKVFTDDEKKYAEVEINAFNENPMNGDIQTIVGKIYSGIGQATKKAEEDAKVAEINSANENASLDIFAEMNSADEDSADDENIF